MQGTKKRRTREDILMKKYSIFGAGLLGQRTLKEVGINNVNCFIDNDICKQGDLLSSVKIVGLKEYIDSNLNDIIIIPFGRYCPEAKKQLEDNGLNNIEIYWCRTSINESVLISNPYAGGGDGISYAHVQSKRNRMLTNEYVLMLYNEDPLFDRVEIETYNRCNGLCDFCPVNIKNDTRVEKLMDIGLFKKIIAELADIEYAGSLCLYSNNEPFMDKRIVDMQRMVREKLPKAHLYLFTNGTLLTLDKFLSIIPYLDEMIIDNYNDELVLNESVKKIADYCEEHPELIKKVTITLRKQHEVLTSRGGDAPNMNCFSGFENDRCIFPFKQIVIRPTGEVSLCCNDPLGKYTLGDLNTQSVLEVWYGNRYREFRRKIVGGRKNIPKCKNCDVFK